LVFVPFDAFVVVCVVLAEGGETLGVILGGVVTDIERCLFVVDVLAGEPFAPVYSHNFESIKSVRLSSSIIFIK